MTTLYRTTLVVPAVVVHQVSDAIENALSPLAVMIGAPAEGDAHDNPQEITVELLTDAPVDTVPLMLILSSFGLASDTAIAQEIVEHKNWVLSALRSLHPVQIERFRIVGSHIETSKADWGIKLQIDAGMAFGTGHHETTTGCLRMMQHVLKKTTPQRVLDVGTGTGILALALKKYRPALHILASDIDAIAVQVARCNMRQNNVFIRCLTAVNTNNPVLRQNAPYDLVTANILAKPLVYMAHQMTALVAQGGGIILAGLLAEQQQWVLHAYRQQGCVLRHVIADNAWRILYLQKMY